ncbi:PAS domain S-box-containing protein/diguanylate cyclase (GGDEF) domain-containing protein [Allopseudospirillum japonicum]|uniref:cyclic-guanylate-specific phosphodiesterase n=1 Tax=Allopseudospirillum japonicum TaxID=64971 RepID=A0A1H6UH74_9GAMM|nr:EAL domain-containing protein [Allopseudospirillum japonicum]SEI87142.1 PAS domain S-box-containing protein/diguanylate cyclase (GGDEF) domain-containing protein [Allopseudospirillum japonicum]
MAKKDRTSYRRKVRQHQVSGRLKSQLVQAQREIDALTHQRERFARAVEASNLGLWEWDLQSDAIYHSHFEQIFGYQEDEVPHFMGNLQPFVHSEDYPKLRRALVDNLKGYTDQFRCRFRIQHKSGAWRWIEDNGRVVEREPDTGRALRMLGTRRDISDEQERHERLRLAWRVFDVSTEAIFILDHAYRIIFVNAAFTRISGFSKAEVLNRRFLEIYQHVTSDLVEHYRQIGQTLRERGHWEGELEEQRKSGEVYPQWLKVYAVPSTYTNEYHYIGMFSDLTQRRQAEERLTYLANYDSLTGLANRNQFRDRLHVSLNHARIYNQKVALLHVDLDRFKAINNTLGHEVGDALLKETAQRISACVRDADTIARLGGDEFVLVLKNCRHYDAVLSVGQRIIEQLKRPFILLGHELLMSASIGVSLFPDHSRELQVLINQADMARNRAKQLGGDNVQLYSEDMQDGSLERLRLERDLRQALQRSSLQVYYQPKLCLRLNRITQAEALVRWPHPQDGMISPGIFVPLAEETGLIWALGEQVLYESCCQIAAWCAQGLEIKVAVNISAHQLRNDKLVDLVQKILAETQAPPHLLELELTESCLMEDASATRDIMHRLRNLGITLAIDDFGTGYSSLGYLQRFPVDVLKIDRCFLQEITSDEQPGTLTRAIVALGHGLGLHVVGEGVETAAQIAFLRRLHCDFAQGYYISPPVPATEFVQVLQDWQQSRAQALAP